MPTAGPAGAAAEIGLILVTIATVGGLARLFESASFLPAVLATGLGAHAVMVVGRHRGWPLLPAVVAGAATTVLLACWTTLLDATTFGIPTPATLTAARDALRASSATFADVAAPAPVLPGFVLSCALAAGTVAVLADWAAFRLRGGFEALLPALALFTFTSALGSGQHRVVAATAWAATSLAFLAAHRLASRRRTAWFGGAPKAGPSSVVRVGAVLAALAALAGAVVGPELPGADDPPLVAYRAKDRPGRTSRATVSPLVDVRGRLVEHSGIEVFTVRSPEARYWRLTALDHFDGALWSSNDTYKRAEGRLAVPEPVRGDEVRQTFEISGLASIWLPAAYRPVRVLDADEVAYNPENASLITSDETADGSRYTVESRLPAWTVDDLRRLGSRPRAVDERYLALPPVAPRVAALADRLTAGQATPFDRARALQDFFRDGFTYDLQVGPGHDRRALEQFLFESRRGYCEQFAGAYAVLARIAGLPARIAVGFTQGEQDSSGRWRVRDEHAHAWPEVWLGEAGWVPFEPTPGRGQPGAERYTGVSPQQAASGQPESATTVPPETTTTVAAATPPSSVPRPGETEVDMGAPDQAEGGLPGWAVALGGLAATVAAAAGLSALLRRRRWARARAEATSPAARAWVAWRAAHESLALAGLRRRPHETLAEHAARAAGSPRVGPAGGAAVARLAEAATMATFAGAALDPDVAARAEQDSAALVTALSSTATRRARLLEAVDPRPLLPGWTETGRASLPGTAGRPSPAPASG